MFNGVSNILGSTSKPVTQVVVPYHTLTTISSSMNPSRTGQPVTLTATVTADGMPVTSGTVTFTRGSQFLGRATLGAEWHGQPDHLVLAPGQCADPGVFQRESR